MSLQFDEARHRYSLDGKPVTGVTTIIGKGPLRVSEGGRRGRRR